ncbi:MAG: hypothetical protein K6356_16635 [Chloroflexus sp.]
MSFTASILISFRSAESNGASPALVNRVARQVVDGLRSQNQTIQPAYDALRSGEIYEWLINASEIAQQLLPLATLSLTIVQLLNELKKHPERPDSPKIEVKIFYWQQLVTTLPILSDQERSNQNDQKLLEQLLQEKLPEQIDPSQISIEVCVSAPDRR